MSECKSYLIRQKYWNMDDGREYKKACIPRLIWNDGHSEWSRSHYWFKDTYDRIGKGSKYPYF